MTNREWRRSRDPVEMIRGLREVASGRKSILYMCAGCRMIWRLFYDKASKRCVEVAERWADGEATEEEVRYARWAGECPTFGHEFSPIIWRKWHPDGSIPASVRRLIEMGVFSERDLDLDEIEVDWDLKGRLLAAATLAESTCRRRPFNDIEGICWSIPRVDWPGDWLLRCVFGKPFLPAVSIDPAWRTAGVLDLARTIYDDRAFDLMPILGNALEQAGCRTADILNHCRSEHTHVRGWWVVDLLLGKS